MTRDEAFLEMRELIALLAAGGVQARLGLSSEAFADQLCEALQDFVEAKRSRPGAEQTRQEVFDEVLTVCADDLQWCKKHKEMYPRDPGWIARIAGLERLQEHLKWRRALAGGTSQVSGDDVADVREAEAQKLAKEAVAHLEEAIIRLERTLNLAAEQKGELFRLRDFCGWTTPSDAKWIVDAVIDLLARTKGRAQLAERERDRMLVEIGKSERPDG